MRAPSVHVRSADFGADYAGIRAIRVEVFVQEQHVPEALEIDDRDRLCVHVLAFLEGEPVGTGRLDPALGGKVGRVAVRARARRRGIGAALMRRLHEVAGERALPAVWCHAQIAAVPFYERLGYGVCGDVFVEAGIDHVTMRRALGDGARSACPRRAGPGGPRPA